jgi:hypothetical protein
MKHTPRLTGSIVVRKSCSSVPCKVAASSGLKQSPSVLQTDNARPIALVKEEVEAVERGFVALGNCSDKKIKSFSAT